MSNLNKTFMVG